MKKKIFTSGEIVITPSGRRACVIRRLHGTGRDCHERVICRYIDSQNKRDLVTLQPGMLQAESPKHKKTKPARYRIVPVNPTPDMLAAGKAELAQTERWQHEHRLANLYQAMLGAAPGIEL